MEIDQRIRYALKQTKILQWPQQLLSTFGPSTINYYVLTEPVYAEFEGRTQETVIREGEVTWNQPKILTLSYLLKGEGFSEEAKRAFEILTREDPELAGALYSLELRREFEKMKIVSGNWREVYKRLKDEIEGKSDPLITIIKGVNVLWDVSLMKFIIEMTMRSARRSQLPDWEKRGFIQLNETGHTVIVKDSSGIPIIARKEIERMFNLVKKGGLGLFELKEELDRWGVFEEYEERFFGLFKEGRR